MEVEVVEGPVEELGRRGPYIGNQEVEAGIERGWVARGCCCGRRNLDDFSNRGCMCLSRGCFVGVGHKFSLHWHAQRLGKQISTQ